MNEWMSELFLFELCLATHVRHKQVIEVNLRLSRDQVNYKHAYSRRIIWNIHFNNYP